MGASLMQQRRVKEEGLRVVNFCPKGRRMTVPLEEAPANYVPAAAVTRRGRALSGITGRKECVGGGRALSGITGRKECVGGFASVGYKATAQLSLAPRTVRLEYRRGRRNS